MLIWLDLETTGLEPRRDAILEAAMIATDDDFVEVARISVVTCAARSYVYHILDPVVRDMHHQNGLWMESLRSNLLVTSLDRASAQSTLVDFVNEHAVQKTNDGREVLPQLAGSTIGFDRAFVVQHMPDLAARLHYRSLDVSSINEVARRTWPAVWEGRPRAEGGARHRATPDIEESLAVARYYRTALRPA